MKRPLFFMFLFLAAGIIFGRYAHPGSALEFLPLVLGACTVSAVIVTHKKTRIAAVFPLFALIGALLVRGSITDDYVFLYETASINGSVAFSGTVTGVSKTSKGRPRAVVRMDQITIDGVTHNAQVNILVYLDFDAETEAGTTVEITGKLSPLRFQRNPGGYDEFINLRSRKIQYTIFAAEYRETGKKFSFAGVIGNIGDRLSNIVYRVLPDSEADILAAMLLGDKSDLSQEIKDLYRDAGIFHILAVSGLHVSIIAHFLQKFLKVLRFRSRHRYIITLVFLAFYCVLTGASPGTVRAALMSGTYITGKLVYRNSDPLTTCAMAAMILLFYEPLYLWDMGFQYSFIAVIGLIIGTPMINKLISALSEKAAWLKKIMSLKPVKENLPSTLAATIATFPVLTFYFFDFPIISLLSNLIIVPTVSITVGFGFITCLAGLFSSGLARAAAIAPRILIQLYESVCRLLVSLPFSKILTGSMEFAGIAAYYAVFIFLAWLCSLPKEKFKQIRGKTLMSAALAAFGLYTAVTITIPAPLTVTLMDVGQGDGILFSKDGSAFVIDGGGSSLEKLGDDTGTWVLMPYMSYLGIQNLAAAFVSHTDSDHTIGIIEAIQKGRIERLFLSQEMGGDSDVYDALIQSANEAGTEVIYITAGDVVVFWGDVTVECLYPDSFTGAAISGNNASMVLRVTAGGVSFLFTGDIEGQSEKAIVSLYEAGALGTDVLKLAHHGSRTSSSEAFLNAVSPELALVSSGNFNRYGHPSTVVVNRLDSMNIPLYNTAKSGAVMMYPNNNEIKIRTMAGKADERVKKTFKIW